MNAIAGTCVGAAIGTGLFVSDRRATVIRTQRRRQP